jgi:arylsulfatase A-like enzyme
MPCLMRWPGRIPAGRVCDELCSTLDLLPTFARLAGAELPPRPIDGLDIGPLLFGQAGASPRDAVGFFYYHKGQLQAVRSGPWKLYLPLEKKQIDLGRRTTAASAQLFDVRHDVGETRELSAENSEIVRRLTALAESARRELGDTDRAGTGQRPAGHVDNPRPLAP